MKTKILVCLSLALTGCVTTKPHVTPTQLTLTRGQNTLRFTVPPGWSPESIGPERGFYRLKRSGAWQPATMSVSFAATPYKRSQANDDYAEQFSISEQFLRYMRTHNFRHTGITCDGHYTADSGREFWLFLEVSNQPHLVSFVPERNCVIEFYLYGDVQDIVRYRQDFYSVLNSYKFQ